MKWSRFAPFLSILILFLAVAFATSLDQSINYLREANARTGDPIPILWTYTLGNLLLAALLLVLFIWTFIRLPRNPWVGVVYLIVGLYISAYPIFYFSPFGRWLLNPNLVISPRSFLFMAGGIIAIIGLAVLFDPLKKTTGSR